MRINLPRALFFATIALGALLLLSQLRTNLNPISIDSNNVCRLPGCYSHRNTAIEDEKEEKSIAPRPLPPARFSTLIESVKNNDHLALIERDSQERTEHYSLTAPRVSRESAEATQKTRCSVAYSVQRDWLDRRRQWKLMEQMDAAKSSSSTLKDRRFKFNQKDVNLAWHRSFTPSKEDAFHRKRETDLLMHMKSEAALWKRFMSMRSDDPSMDDMRKSMNSLGLTVNHGNFSPSKDHIPIWLRVFRRTHPLDLILKSICRIHSIQHTILIVTVDGDTFGPILDLIKRVDCVKVRIYWHSARLDLLAWNISPSRMTTTVAVNTHFLYGLYLTLRILEYPYVITLEDDIEPGPDFYHFHKSLYTHTTSHESKFVSLTPSPNGPNSECRLAGRLLNDRDKDCTQDTRNTLVTDDYFGGWGAGIPDRILDRFMGFWRSIMQEYVYDGLFITLMRDGERLMAPCSIRARWVPNVGTHGGDKKPRWESLIPMREWIDWPENNRTWVVI